MPSMRIAHHLLTTPYSLAPMAGVSELPYRLLVRELGASLTPTELVSAEGLARAAAKTLRYLRFDPQRERPFCVQLFGGAPERVAEAGRVAQANGAEILDLNMGCPVPKVTRGGAGAAMMCDPPRAAAMVEAVRKATGLPVTAKIRSGWDATQVNAVEFARTLEQAGVAAIAVHGRTRAQGYSGKADWSVIGRVKAAVSVPVIGNGDVKCRADAERMQRETGCDGVMVGRGALGNPWVFRELTGGPAPTPAERCAVVLRHFDEHVAHWGSEDAAVRSFRKMLLWYARGLRGAVGFRARATGLATAAEVREAVAQFFADAEPDPSMAGDEALEIEGGG